METVTLGVRVLRFASPDLREFLDDVADAASSPLFCEVNETVLSRLPNGWTLVVNLGLVGPINAGAAGDGVASCVGNEKAVGGGFAAASGFGRLDGSRPELNGAGVPTGWHIFVGNDSPGSASFTVYVLCITP